MNPKSVRSRWKGALITVVFSALGGGICYALWMVVAIPANRRDVEFLSTTLWILAPVVTALGFATGTYLSEGWLGRPGRRFGRILIWPLVGCTIGAWSVYFFGPMLIVFGMLTLGTASIALREILVFYGKTNLH